MTKRTPKTTKPVNLRSLELESARVAWQAAREASDKFNRVLTHARRAEFKAACGCSKCGGRGWVVVWSTLDGDCYTEYGTCPECGGDKSRPFDRSYYSKDDRNHYRNHPGLYATEEESEIAAQHSEIRHTTEARYQAAREALEPGVGRTLVAVSGRKVKPGTIAQCVWYGRGRAFGYGEAPLRVGVKLASGEVVYSDASNFEAYAPA